MDIHAVIADFRQAASLAGIDLSPEMITVEVNRPPHAPPGSLPAGKMAVYIFQWGNQCLKIGKVGPKSQARYTSQHYSPKSCNSNLAKSILKDKNSLGLIELTEDTVGGWIKRHTDRVNILIDEAVGTPVLSLLESFLQCRLKPRFEGFESQR